MTREGRRPGVARRGARAGLLVLGCVLALLAAVALWTRLVVLDTDRYVATVAPLAERPDVQHAISDRLGDRLVRAADAERFAQDLLPGRSAALAPAIGAGVESVIRREVGAFVSSDAFARIWDGANRRAHATVIRLVTGEADGPVRLVGDTVVLDLSPAVAGIRDRLARRGLDRLAARIPDEAGRDVPIARSAALRSARSAVHALEVVAVVLPLLALLALAGSVALGDGVRRPLLQAVLGVALTMLLLLGLIGVGRSAYLSALGSGTLPRDAMASVYDAVLRLLRDGARVAVIACAVVAVAAALLARTAPGGRAGSVAREHRGARQRAVVGAAGIVLLVWSAPGAGVVGLIAALAIAAVAAIALLARAAVP